MYTCTCVWNIECVYAYVCICIRVFKIYIYVCMKSKNSISSLKGCVWLVCFSYMKYTHMCIYIFKNICCFEWRDGILMSHRGVCCVFLCTLYLPYKTGLVERWNDFMYLEFMYVEFMCVSFMYVSFMYVSFMCVSFMYVSYVSSPLLQD